MLIFGERQLRAVLTEYVDYVNHARPHQGLNQHIPMPANVVAPPEQEPRNVIALPILGGLHHDYQWAA